jgi:hypothetical protein
MLWVVWQRSRTRWALVKASASLLEGMVGVRITEARRRGETGCRQQWEPVSSAVEGCERCMNFFRSARLSAVKYGIRRRFPLCLPVVDAIRNQRENYGREVSRSSEKGNVVLVSYIDFPLAMKVSGRQAAVHK